MLKYFVAYRYRCILDINYVKQFLHVEKDYVTFHNSYEKALQELHEGFYDDCDYGVFSIDKKGEIKNV